MTAEEMKDPREQGPKPPYPEQTQPAPGTEDAMTPQADHGQDSYRGFNRLQDRATLITGGDSGIGRAVAIAFAREGADVLISYLDEHEDAQETVRLVEEAGRRAVAVPGDIGDEAHCRSLVDRAVSEFGRLDVLVNNAAFQTTHDTITEHPSDEIEGIFRTNILAMFWLCKAAVPHMKPGATIVNTASIQAYQPEPMLLPYSTTKGAIVTFTKGLAQDLTPKGIRVNAVAPGPVWTPLIPMSMPAEKTSQFGAETPIARAAQPAELAPPYVFLACDESRFVSGEILAVTGGLVTA
ncbi:MAG: SDR family oxidoreductase [Actinomycetota bacterium]|nr:SDR family oxidoreductase [Actinomycetota bacterium]